MSILGIVALVTVGSLVWSASQLRRTAGIIRDTRNMVDTDSVQLGLLTYRRLADLYYLTGGPEVAVARDEVRLEVQQRLADGQERSSEPEEQELLRVSSVAVREWFDERQRLERTAGGLGDVVRGARPHLERADETLAAVREMNAERVESARRSTLRTAQITETVAIAAVILLVLGTLAVLGGVRALVTHPTLALHAAIRRFRSGDMSARATPMGASELREVSEAFNGMAATLGRQRQRQLEFLAGVVHDLRNPLSGLAVGMETLDEVDDPATRERTITLVRRQVDRLSRMVDDLLESARIDAGQFELSRDIIDLRDPCLAVVQLYAPTTNDHEIVCDVGPEPVTVDADPERVEQIVGNLLSNAIKFSPEGGRIDVRVRADDGGAFVEVQDRGIGIPRDAIPELFAPFRRRRPEIAPGAGLGLSIVRKLVDAHGGTIEVDSAEGAGSTFRVRLPAAAGDERPVRSHHPASRRPTTDG